VQNLGQYVLTIFVSLTESGTELTTDSCILPQNSLSLRLKKVP